jgi:hypothetical protein
MSTIVANTLRGIATSAISKADQAELPDLQSGRRIRAA